MAKAYLNLASILDNKYMSVSLSPFNQNVIVLKRASFAKGTTPDHLRQYALPTGTGAGMNGTTSFQGKLIPTTAANVAKTKTQGTLEQRKERRRESSRKSRARAKGRAA